MRIAILWIINEQDEILISQRALDMDSDAGLWGPSVSGKIESDESPEQAVVREAQEELGVDPAKISVQHLHTGSHLHLDGEVREMDFFYTRVSKQHTRSFRLEPREVAAVRWMSLDDLQNKFETNPDEILVSYNTDLWHTIFTQLQRVLT